MREPTVQLAPPRVEDLTPRHREVLQLLARGKTNFEIAEALGISLEGAKYHVREIMGRLGVDSREDAATWFRAQRRPAARARRGLGWFVPRLAVVGAIAFAAMLAFVTVAVGMGIGGFMGGGKPAAAYVPICNEGDVALAVESELRDGSQSRNGDPAVLIRVRISTNNVKCYLGGKLTMGPEPFDWANSRIFPASVALDAILGSQEASVSFDVPAWCEDLRGEELVVRAGGSAARVSLDHPGEPCAEMVNATCRSMEGAQYPCQVRRNLMGMAGSAEVGTQDLLPRCNPERIRVGLDASLAPIPLPAVAPPEAVAAASGTFFALTFSTPDRPLDCEFQSAATFTFRDAAGELIDLEPNGMNHSFTVRFRRATLPIADDGSRKAQQVHIPDTGGRGDHSTETSLITIAEGIRYLWRNWCGDDRSPVTLEVTTAAGRMTATLERPPCVEPEYLSTLGPISWE